MRYSLTKNFLLFYIGFTTYITMEVLFRGYSFPLMGLCGGIAIVILDKINDRISWDMDVIIQGLLGSLLITLFELIVGEISLHGYLPAMWDYSNLPFNYRGIICFPFSVLWIFVSIFGIMVADAINYYVLEELPVPYYRLFGKRIITFKEKHCRLN